MTSSLVIVTSSLTSASQEEIERRMKERREAAATLKVAFFYVFFRLPLLLSNQSFSCASSSPIVSSYVISSFLSYTHMSALFPNPFPVSLSLISLILITSCFFLASLLLRALAELVRHPRRLRSVAQHPLHAPLRHVREAQKKKQRRRSRRVLIRIDFTAF